MKSLIMSFATLVAIVALTALLLTTGCRVVSNESSVTNNFNSGRDLTVKDSGQEGTQEGTQAADKKVGDISPSTEVTAP